MYVSVETAAAIAITAAEGGIGYWSQISYYDWKEIERKTRRSDTFYEIRVMNDDESGYEKDARAIDTELIQRGVNIYLTQDIYYGPDAGIIAGQLNFEHRQFSDMDDLSAMDSSEADIVIQLGLFGRLVFG